MQDLLFKIDNASVFIPGLQERKLVLKDINWTLRAGEHTALLGPNGAGKSSLLKLLHGDLWPCAGNISWFNELGQREDSRIAARELTAIISPALQEQLQRQPWQLSLGNWLRDSSQTRAARGKTALVAKIHDLLAQNPWQSLLIKPLNALSQGQLRLGLLLAALLRQPRILLLDEYADSLDAENRQLALDLLELARQECTLIFTSHREDKLPNWCAGRLYLQAGRQIGQKTEKARPQKIEFINSTHLDSPTLFALRNVSVYIQRRKILDKINWQAKLGEHWRISGKNGSGKSTFLRLLAGDEFPALGGEIRRWNPLEKKWMSSLAEARGLLMSVSDLAQVLNEYPQSALDLLCSGFDNSTGLHREILPQERREAFALLREFFPEEDAQSLAQTDIRRLSTGQIRRLYLGRAMLMRPAALLLDEPLNGLDSQSRERFLAALRDLAALGNAAPSMIMVSHYVEDVPSFIERHACLEEGHLLTLS